MSIHHLNHRMVGAAPALTLALGLGLAAPVALATTTEAAVPTARAVMTPSGAQLTYTAASGQINQVTVTETKDHGFLRYLIDDSVPISVEGGCTHPDSADLTKIACSIEEFDSQDPYETLTMNLGDRDDSVVFDNRTDQGYYFNVISLGTGNDKLSNIGATDSSYSYGNSGNDTITVGKRGSTHGGDGNDIVYTAGYGAFADGGNGNDVIHGGAEIQVLRGGAGNDTISGGGSGDTLYGGTGNDRLSGGKGNDTLYGNSGNDRLYGNAGNDTLNGGPGTDQIDGGPGKDTVTS